MNGVNVERVIDRFKGLLELQKVLSLEVIEAKFNEHDLKEIMYLLGELKTIKIGKEEFADLKDFVRDIIGIYNNATGYGYYPEDLEIDFDDVMEKWNKKIEHYKWR